MNLQDIVFEVRKTLDETETTFGELNGGAGTWDDTQITGYVNEGIGLLTHRLRLQGTSTITLSTSTSQYNLPADCLEDGIRKVVYNATGVLGSAPVKPIDLDEYERLLLNPPNVGVGFGGYRYTIWSGQIWLTPYPRDNSDTITLLYYKTAPSLTNATDIPSSIPERFHIALVYFALARCQESQEESQLQQMAMQQFEQYRAQMMAELARTSRDRNRVRRK